MFKRGPNICQFHHFLKLTATHKLNLVIYTRLIVFKKKKKRNKKKEEKLPKESFDIYERLI